MKALKQPAYLPMTREETRSLGWNQLDVLIISGDAYVDHPTFGPALLGRWLVEHGYRVGIVAQPDWRDPASLEVMGRPRLLAGVTAGALDSMLAHYTAFKKKRRDDAYTPGGQAGARPDRAVIVYANLARQAFPGLPVVLGGIEASLRRVSHYDFWSGKLRRPIILDAKAECLLYGMAENSLLEACRRVERAPGQPASATLLGLAGGAVMGREEDLPPGEEVIRLPSHEEIEAQPAKLVDATLDLERQVHQAKAWAVQLVGGRLLLLAPPAPPLTTAELDRLYGLPFARAAHPSYKEAVPGLATVADSITSHRGCGGGCSFCSLALHQGRAIRSRSAGSIKQEARGLAARPGWHGSISDIGGPSANMWGGFCAGARGDCQRQSCLTPAVCPEFRVDQEAIIDLLDQVAALPGVKNLRVASGVRFDLALQSPVYCRELVAKYVGGQLKLAPEHVNPGVLKLMRKPGPQVFERFLELFQRISQEAGKKQYIVPYLMSGFPGCGPEEMRELAAWLASRGWRPQQVQCFVPTPGALGTAMFHAGVDGRGKAVKVDRTSEARRAQHDLLVPREAGRPAAKNTPARAGQTCARPGGKACARDNRRQKGPKPKGRKT